VPGIDRDVACLNAEDIEHHLRPATVRKFERQVEFLKSPAYLGRIKEAVEEG